MYGYTMRINQPLETYRALHDAVIEIAGRDVEGLILHFAHATDEGFAITEIWQAKEKLDAFNRDVFPRVVESSGLSLGEDPPEVSEFTPVVVVTPGAYDSDRAG